MQNHWTKKFHAQRGLGRMAALLVVLLFSLPRDVWGEDSGAYAGKPAIYFGFINDNYTGDVEQGIKGDYFGADDFLTFSLFTQVNRTHHEFSLVYNMLTSRKLLFRSDLLTAIAARSFKKGPFTLKPGAGVVLRDNLGGEDLQNWFHELTNVPEVTLPFLDKAFGVIVLGIAQTSILPGHIPGGDIYSISEVKLASNVVPSRLTQVFVYRTDPIWQRVRLELRGGARYHLNEVTGYSEMLRPGLVGGLQLEGRLFRELHIRFGVTLFPGENLGTDPIFKPKDFEYSPQIVTMISWHPDGVPFQEFIKY